MLNPLMHMLWLEERARETEHHVRTVAHRRAIRAGVPPVPEAVTLRLETVHDEPAIARLLTLAGRSRRQTWGRHVVAEVDGEIVAALPLSGGDAFADPFRRTAHLIPLLQLRARQVNDPPTPPRRRRAFLRWSTDSRLP